MCVVVELLLPAILGDIQKMATAPHKLTSHWKSTQETAAAFHQCSFTRRSSLITVFLWVNFADGFRLIIKSKPSISYGKYYT